MAQSRLPCSVAWLGYGGLLPFLALAIMSVGEPNHGILYRGALLAYGAVILSFVGALHWAFAMTLAGLTESRRTSSFVWSVVPALMAWSAYFFTPVLAALILILGFLAQYLRDQALARCVPLPNWYLPLRIKLTLVACVSLAVGAATAL
jgi:hypothetical protein